MKSKICNGEARSSEKDFENLQLGAFATPSLLPAQGPEGLTAESGFNSLQATFHDRQLVTWTALPGGSPNVAFSS
jgi:hypothetical protein